MHGLLYLSDGRQKRQVVSAVDVLAAERTIEKDDLKTADDVRAVLVELPILAVTAIVREAQTVTGTRAN